MAKTGKINVAELDLVEKVVNINRVQKVHKGGRHLRWNALVVVGDKRGVVGVGLGKAREVPDAIRKGLESARKALCRVALSGSSVPHDAIGVFRASRVIVHSAAPGTGVIAGAPVRAVMDCVGVRDVLAKSLGSDNPINTVKATIAALQQMRTPAQVLEMRGKLPYRRKETAGAAAD